MNPVIGESFVHAAMPYMPALVVRGALECNQTIACDDGQAVLINFNQSRDGVGLKTRGCRHAMGWRVLQRVGVYHHRCWSLVVRRRLHILDHEGCYGGILHHDKVAERLRVCVASPDLLVVRILVLTIWP